MSHAVISYPELDQKDFSLIQDFRRHNDLYFSVVGLHFTFVFPVYDFDMEEFIDEAVARSTGVQPVEFEIRCATVNKDSFSDYYHLLLVPDKGFSDIVKLHDRLYSNLFFGELRLDIDFIPHIGIANNVDRFVVKKWADEWNGRSFSIKGRIKDLMVIDFTDNVVTDLVRIELDSGKIIHY